MRHIIKTDLVEIFQSASTWLHFYQWYPVESELVCLSWWGTLCYHLLHWGSVFELLGYLYGYIVKTLKKIVPWLLGFMYRITGQLSLVSLAWIYLPDRQTRSEEADKWRWAFIEGSLSSTVESSSLPCSWASPIVKCRVLKRNNAKTTASDNLRCIYVET